MPRTGRPKAELILTEQEREQLLRWSRRAKSSQALALRSRIVLGGAEGVDNNTVAARVGCSANTVSKWRGRFVEHRLDGLGDEPRPGRPPSIVTADLLQRSDHRSVQALEADIRNWVKAWNDDPKPFIWTKSAEQILASLGRLLQRTTGAGH